MTSEFPIKNRAIYASKHVAVLYDGLHLCLLIFKTVVEFRQLGFFKVLYVRDKLLLDTFYTED